MAWEQHPMGGQLVYVARAVGVSAVALRQAIITADGGSGAKQVNITVRVPIGNRRSPISDWSLLGRTATELGVSGRALQDAIIASRPHAQPGQTVSLGMRLIEPSRGELSVTGKDKYEQAKLAAGNGDVWAGEWLHLADQLRSLARRL